MAENGSPQLTRGPNGYNRYNRLSTMDMESQANPTVEEDSSKPRLIRMLESFCEDERNIVIAVLAVFIVIVPAVIYFTDFGAEVAADPQFAFAGRDPIETGNEFVLDSVTISEFQASPAQVRGKCDVVVNISNPYKRSIYYETSVLSVFLGHELLWVTRTEGLFLEAHEGVTFTMSMNATTVSVPASFAPTALLDSQKTRQPLKFKLKYDGTYRVGMNSWGEGRTHVYVVCGWIEMQFVDDKTLKGGPAGCFYEDDL